MNKRKFDDCDGSETPSKIRETSKNFAENLLPDKSGRLYKQCYDQFIEWQTQQNTNSVSEETILVYFEELSKKLKPSSLWAKYSMLKSTILNFRYVDIGRYKQLSAFMAQNSKGYVSTKAKVLEPRDVKKFLAEAPDRRYLAVKVALIFGITGGCRREELKNITIHDIEHHDKIIVVKIPRTNSEISRKFMIEGEFCDIIKKYEALRPRDVPSDRFFLCLRDGKCTQQVIGINTFGAMPKTIAEFLGLDEPDKYTGHSFRRTSATMLADAGADLSRDDSWSNNSRDCNFLFSGARKSDIGMNKSSVLLNFELGAGSATNSEGATSSYSLANEDSDTFGSSTINLRTQTSRKKATIACQTKDWWNVGPRIPDTLFCWNGKNEASTQTNIFIIPSTNKMIRKKIIKKDRICGPEMIMKSQIFAFWRINSDVNMQYLSGLSIKDFRSFLQLMISGKSNESNYERKITMENQLLLFFMKIKLGLEFNALSALFGIRRSIAIEIFTRVLKTLVEQLKTWIIWPSKESFTKDAPSASDNYSKFRCIIDYIEIPIDTPSSIEKRIFMYSHKKGAFTAKFLIAFTPDGFICKVSKSYGGRTTDNFINDECGFSNLIENGEVVRLTDEKSGELKNKLTTRNSENNPSSLETNLQLNSDDIEENVKTDKFKNHVEKALARVKLSKILKHINHELIPHIDAIMHMCCVVANIKAL